MIPRKEWEKQQYHQTTKIKKQEYIQNLFVCFISYPTIFVLDTSKARSQMIQNIRKKLRSHYNDTLVVLGKWRLIQVALEKAISTKPHLKQLSNYIKGNRGLIFTFGDAQTVVSVVDSECQWCPVAAGMTCPVDVYLPKGRTDLDPTQTSFLPALNISSKICFGKIEFISDTFLIPKGSMVGNSQASLLKILHMAPIPRKVDIIAILEHGFMCDPVTLINIEKRVLNTLMGTIQNIECIGKAIGYPTTANFERTLLQGYTNLLCVCMATDYSFCHAENTITQILYNQLVRNGNIDQSFNFTK